jgi:hypothetical protein
LAYQIEIVRDKRNMDLGNAMSPAQRPFTLGGINDEKSANVAGCMYMITPDDPALFSTNYMGNFVG